MERLLFDINSATSSINSILEQLPRLNQLQVPLFPMNQFNQQQLLGQDSLGLQIQPMMQMQPLNLSHSLYHCPFAQSAAQPNQQIPLIHPPYQSPYITSQNIPASLQLDHNLGASNNLLAHSLWNVQQEMNRQRQAHNLQLEEDRRREELEQHRQNAERRVAELRATSLRLCVYLC